MRNLLDEKEIEVLKSSENVTYKLTSLDLLKGACSHCDSTGHDTLIFNDSTAIARCSICGAEFRPVRDFKDDIDQVINNVVDILESIKIANPDIADYEGAKELFGNLIPRLKKIPNLYNDTAKKFNMPNSKTLYVPKDNISGQELLNNVNSVYGKQKLVFTEIPGSEDNVCITNTFTDEFNQFTNKTPFFKGE